MAAYADMPLIRLLDDSRSVNFETAAFRTAVEDHLQLLKTSAGVQTLSGQAIDAVVFEGDLYGFLAKLGVEKRIRWTAMRMNGYTSPQEYAGERIVFVIPDIDQLDRLASAVASRQLLQL
jgi:hypothetical protein